MSIEPILVRNMKRVLEEVLETKMYTKAFHGKPGFNYLASEIYGKMPRLKYEI